MPQLYSLPQFGAENTSLFSFWFKNLLFSLFLRKKKELQQSSLRFPSHTIRPPVALSRSWRRCCWGSRQYFRCRNPSWQKIRRPSAGWWAGSCPACPGSCYQLGLGLRGESMSSQCNSQSELVPQLSRRKKTHIYGMFIGLIDSNII